MTETDMTNDIHKDDMIASILRIPLPPAVKSAARRKIISEVIPLLCSLLLLSSCGDTGKDPVLERPEAAAATAVEIRDAHGEVLRLEAPPRRIVSLAPNLTEMVYALGAGELLAGRTAYCDYPAEVAAVPVVSDIQTPDYEKILTIRPDLVLMTFAGNSEGAYRKLKDLGVPVFAFSASTVDGVIASLDTLGQLLGRQEKGMAVSGNLRRRVDSIGRIASLLPPVSTFIVIDRAPLMTVSHGFLADAVAIAGGRNVAAGSATAYPQFSREELLRLDPDCILYPDSRPDAVTELLKLYPEWSRLRSVAGRRVYRVAPDLVGRPGPRIADGIELLYRTLHAGADSVGGSMGR